MKARVEFKRKSVDARECKQNNENAFDVHLMVPFTMHLIIHLELHLKLHFKAYIKVHKKVHLRLS